ncbi:MAG TPA: glycine--tRNA ligase subunit beta, partial [Alphaproteobacteria bacterium]|nr:glycine--tRNA ligase subunit beta [Alphaproteobacteria bacterium]
MAELLVELFSEEIPARMQARAADDLKRLATDAFKAAGLEFSKAEAYVTPRRLALVVDGLPVAQADLKEERRGPRVDAPQNAIDGFLRASGLTLDQCEQRDTGKGVFYFAVVEKKGRATADVLAETLPKIFAELPWPKSMRWAREPTRWVRPLHGIVALFDGKIVPVSFAGVTSGDETRGHRFLGPKPFKAKSFSEYKAKLREGYVLLDATDRRATILADASAVAKDAGFALKRDDGLLDEVTGLVEWPVALMGKIDEQFMDVPAEVLTTSMRAHQKYFAVEKGDGQLAARFIVIANMLTEDGGAQVIAGNERVLRARLSDARFFWDQDRKHRLDSRIGALKDIVFHAKLGTVAEKVARVKKLAREIAELIGADGAQAERAAELCKADLTTGMVGEFPELQGVMGRYYARHDNERPEVAEAIAAHYSPKGPDDACPTAPVSVALALADKIDTLVGFFAIDEK